MAEGRLAQGDGRTMKRERQSYDDEAPLLPALSVYEREEPDKSGLLDADGNPLVRPREPIGFIRNRR